MKNKIVAAILALFVGSLGIHWFYLGKNNRGLAYLLITVLLCWTVVAPIIISVIAFVEGVLLLLEPDAEFDEKYNNPPTDSALQTPKNNWV